MRYDDAIAWFLRIHEANEAVYQGNGSWHPHPLARYAGTGISVEEVALRVPGYISAYQATDESVYLERAVAGAEYFLRERLFADGHVLLQGHLSVDFCYSLAGVALLKLWEIDRSRMEYFEAAQKIGDRLLECNISGSVNHNCIPVQVFGPLYRHTGDHRYLTAALRRVFTHTLPFQRRTGDWGDYQAYVWYQSIILNSLTSAYVSMPHTLKFSRRKDRLARSIIAAVNWFPSVQNADGSLPTTCSGGFHYPEGEREVVEFDGTCFIASPMKGGYPGHGAYEIDALVSIYEKLNTVEVLSVVHGYARYMEGINRLWRLEFNTFGAGRYLGLLARLRNLPKASFPTPSDLEANNGEMENRHPVLP